MSRCPDCRKKLSPEDVARGQTTCDDCFDRYYRRATPEERASRRAQRRDLLRLDDATLGVGRIGTRELWREKGYDQ
jgi:hypothetical protein